MRTLTKIAKTLNMKSIEENIDAIDVWLVTANSHLSFTFSLDIEK